MHSPFCAVDFGACVYEDDGKKWVIMHNKSLHGRKSENRGSDMPFYRGHLVFEYQKTFNYVVFHLMVGEHPHQDSSLAFTSSFNDFASRWTPEGKH